MSNENTRCKSVERTLSGYPFPDFFKLSFIAHPDYETTYSYALNFANYTYDHAELRKYTEQYLTKRGIDLYLGKIPDWAFYCIGIQAWLHVKGCALTEERLKEIDNEILALHKKYDIPDEKPRDLKGERTSDLIGELEGLLDDAVRGVKLTQPLEIIRNAGIVSLEDVGQHFQDQLAEIDNPNNAEFFRGKHNAKIIMVLKIILQDLSKAYGIKQVSTKPKTQRAPRKLNPSKLVKSLKYLKEDKECALTSINPECIINSEILWVYNAKTRKLGRYVAKDGQKLLVKGSTLLNYDEGQSTMKIVRKPKEIFPKLLSAGKVEQRKLLDSLNAVEQRLNGRINRDTVLVKVY